MNANPDQGLRLRSAAAGYPEVWVRRPAVDDGVVQFIQGGGNIDGVRVQIDTGADRSLISLDLLHACGLHPKNSATSLLFGNYRAHVERDVNKAHYLHAATVASPLLGLPAFKLELVAHSVLPKRMVLLGLYDLERIFRDVHVDFTNPTFWCTRRL